MVAPLVPAVVFAFERAGHRDADAAPDAVPVAAVVVLELGGLRLVAVVSGLCAVAARLHYSRPKMS